ncbi:uncharacterized protein LOC122050693 [Zingiber officinale]|uniref:uncharacterized protein LOC122050693 n=1 Tax=Zingiber officinale TaxID=94328 RepID=UPI001C4C00C3|nr:uncharacterized protein LOC122050693 [Zingiber officinale]
MVDSITGCKLICMLDAYQGYHQAPLAWSDQEKVSFITADDTYCYNVMPFELKNADATYQRLMNKVFRKQIRRNLEVYVDDILIKSLRAVNLCEYIEETFHTLRMYGVKLNPQKCLFGAKSGRFLGYIVTERGIEANPSKKLAFVLVLAAWRLRPYFLAHIIVVMMNNPLGRVLLNPEASRRLIKWITELSEFDIQYQSRTAIKAQSLADFITEVQNPEPAATWSVYVDGSTAWQGSNIVLLLISPQEERMHLSIRLDYRATNNEVEYETLIARLQATRHVGASKVLIYSDSQLVAQQLLGTFEINNTRLKLYAEAFNKLKTNFGEVVIQKIPRAENQAADELAKLASSITSIVTQQPIKQVSLVAHIDRMEGLAFPNDWRTTIVEFLRSGAAPSDQDEAQLLRRRAGRFTLIGDQLYKKVFSHPLLKCVSSEDAKYILKEVHQGSCGGHPGGRSLVKKILLAGYFWPTLQEDVARTVATCLSCQRYHSFSHRPTEEMKASTVACLFNQWGMDIVGPFLMATG